MKSAVAIKRYMEKQPNGSTVSPTELTAFKKVCTPEEWGAVRARCLRVDWRDVGAVR